MSDSNNSETTGADVHNSALKEEVSSNADRYAMTKKKSGKDRISTKNRKRAFIITFTLLTLVGLAGIVGFMQRAAERSSAAREVSNNFASLPTVSGTVTSSTDGSPHTIDIDLTVEFAEGKKDSVNDTELYSKIQETVLSLDYESLKSDDSVDYIKSSVINTLAQMTDADNISNVYIGNIVIDFPGAIESGVSSQNGNNNDKLRGLFNSIN